MHKLCPEMLSGRESNSGISSAAVGVNDANFYRNCEFFVQVPDRIDKPPPSGTVDTHSCCVCTNLLLAPIES